MAVHPTRKEEQPLRAGAPQDWAALQVAAQHIEALVAYGELCLYTMMWRAADFEEGRVRRCPVCFTGAESRQAAAFKQATKRECPNCFGTTYEGGFRAQIIRPTLLADRNQESLEDRRGTVTRDTILLETTSDFTLRKDDYLFRFDNTRFQVEEKSEAVVRTGFHPASHLDSVAGSTTAHMEEDTTVAFRIPPTNAAGLRALLGRPGGYLIEDLTALDEVRPGGYL